MKTLMTVAIAGALMIGGAFLYADDDDYEHVATTRVKPATPQDKAASALYQKECSACHMAYQPSFLPKKSWEKTMTSLGNHFGTDASLDPADQKMITSYLMTHASKNDRITDMKGAVALRISQTPHFVSEHREIAKKWITQSEVKSIANCNACHTKAEAGSYREREIRIPNYGRWE